MTGLKNKAVLESQNAGNGVSPKTANTRKERSDMKTYDLVIIGAGPAGMTAAIYANRAQMNFALLEKGFPGGQMLNTYEIENYTGFSSISGMDLSQKMQEHLQYLGGSVEMADIQSLSLTADGLKEIRTETESYLAKNVIVATGATPRKLGVRGEEEFSGRGVSYCATCDGAFYKGLTALVIGGGDVAVEDAIYLSRVCKKVYLAHRRDELRAVKNLQTKLMSIPNIEVLWFTEAEEILGDSKVQAIRLRQNQTGEISELAVDGVFIAVGSIPNTAFLGDIVTKDEQGCIVADQKCESDVEGIFAVGDLRSGSVRQILAACGDAVVAIMEIDKRL